MNNRVYIKTWGCQMNEYDSSKILDLLKDNHYSIAKSAEEADILLLNTCSIREKAQEKLFHQLGRWKKLKKANPKTIIGVGGCVASQEKKNIIKRAGYVDIVFGPQTIHCLPSMISSVRKYNKSVVNTNFLGNYKFENLPKPHINKPTAYISIMEGCNKYCTYCIVPYTRGREFSRPCNDIISEVKILAKQGVREINLLGQNVNAYCGLDSNYKTCSFANLIRMVAKIDGIDRIRFTTSNPAEFTDDIIDLYSDIPKLASFLHLPVQSGSDRILKKMRRSYTISEYKNIVKKLRAVRPNIQISSDFIVGFPGESQEDFDHTMNLISDINFDMSFSFIYSVRPGTPAAKMLDNISIAEKKQRLYKIQNQINKQAINWSCNMLGSVQCILVEGVSRNDIMKLYGRTENNRLVDFEGNPNMIGKFVKVKVNSVSNNLLHGFLLKDNLFNSFE